MPRRPKESEITSDFNSRGYEQYNLPFFGSGSGLISRPEVCKSESTAQTREIYLNLFPSKEIGSAGMQDGCN